MLRSFARLIDMNNKACLLCAILEPLTGPIKVDLGIKNMSIPTSSIIK